MTRPRFFIFLAIFFLSPVFVFAKAPAHTTPAQTSTTSPVLIATSTPASLSSDTQALIKELQALVISLQTQINELKAKLETTQQEVAVVKSEIQFTAFLAKGAQGDEVKQLQELLAQDPEIYPEGTITGFFGPATESAVKRFQEKHKIDALGVIGPKTRAKLNELMTQGAGKSGVVPSGLTSVLSAQQAGATSTLLATTTPSLASTTPGNAIASLTATTTASIATTSPALLCAKDAKYCATKEACATASFSWYTVSCHKDPPPVYSCAASYNYCISPTECAAQGWYSCRNSCYPSVDACQGQAYVSPATPAAIPAVPATTVTSAQVIIVTTTTAIATTTTTSTVATSLYGSALNFGNVSDLLGKIWGPGSNGIILGGGLNFSTQVGVGWAQQYGGKYVTAYSLQGASSNYITQTGSVNVSVTGPAGSIIEVWDLETLAVVATNMSSPGSPTIFTAQPNHRYGGFGWYADNAQKNIEIHAALSSSSQTSDTTPPTISNIQATASSTSAVIAWTTDEWSDSQVEWGGTSAYGAVATNPSFITSHSIPFSGLASGATYHYRVKSKDAAGNLAVSGDQTFTTAAPPVTIALPAPTSIRADWFTSWPDYRDNNVGQQIIFQYPGDSASKTTTFRFYQKSPGNSSFSLVGEFSGFDSTSCTANGTRAYAGGWGLIGAPWTSCQYWAITRNPVAASSYAVGEYSYYVVAVDAAGKEGPPSATAKQIFFQPVTIVAPIASQSPVSTPPTFQWTVGSGWPATAPGSAPLLFTIAIFDSSGAVNPVWTTNIDGVYSPGTNLKVYNGPALDPSKRYRLTVYGWGSQSTAGPSYMALPSAVADFWVSSATTTSAIIANPSLASTLESLRDTLSALTKLLQKSR